MKIFAISDLHLSFSTQKPMNIFGDKWENYLEEIEKDWNEKVSNDDIVLISGDISWGMKLDEAKADLDYIAKLKGRKIIIKGNHDYWWSSYSKVKSILKTSVIAIQNDSIKIENYVIAGTRGWCVPEKNSTQEDIKIFNREVLRLKLSLESARKKLQEGDRLICMMHYPPFNAKYEDSEMTKVMKDFKVDAVVYGHLHGSGSRANLLVTINGIPYYLTSCDIVKNTLIQIF